MFKIQSDVIGIGVKPATQLLFIPASGDSAFKCAEQKFESSASSTKRNRRRSAAPLHCRWQTQPLYFFVHSGARISKCLAHSVHQLIRAFISLAAGQPSRRVRVSQASCRPAESGRLGRRRAGAEGFVVGAKRIGRTFIRANTSRAALLYCSALSRVSVCVPTRGFDIRANSSPALLPKICRPIKNLAPLCEGRLYSHNLNLNCVLARFATIETACSLYDSLFLYDGWLIGAYHKNHYAHQEIKIEITAFLSRMWHQILVFFHTNKRIKM